ncbi:MAG TPA: hypothetical protein VHF89_04710, partial [Solirubrobacteraceae bacterium]|nr:hypothetical protein [Solirubrobacteraceae bacterium]
AIARHYEILDEAIARHGGARPVEQGEGDSVVAAFTRARDAVASALDAQRALLAEDWPPDAQLRVRMALHTGDAQLRDEGNYFGGAVNRCARLRAVAHGGQVLLSGATAELVVDHLPDGADLSDLGMHRLRDLGRAERVFALVHPDLLESVPPPRSLDQVPNNLPVQLTSFVGRGRELVELETLLASTRLLTLAGAGGCGKTRLALQLAADALDRFPDGAWCLELAPLSDPGLIESALATTVGVRPLPGQTSLEAAVFHLAAQRALVLLDNCEHVLETCAHVAEVLLHGCLGVTVLATSREPLGVGGETTWRVPSLSLPPEQTGDVSQSLGSSDAMRLFSERATKVHPSFAVTSDSAAHVAQICQELDGIPLAIELAAARVRVLSPEQIAERLDDAFRLLTSGSRTALPRHRTLRGTMDWSYRLLSEREQVLLGRLAVFAGSFSLEAAEEVCAGAPLEAEDILDGVAALVDKSLVVMEPGDAEARYRLLETVRQYGAEQLTAAGAVERYRERHARHFLAFAESNAPHLFGGEDEPGLVARMALDHDNLRAASAWAAGDPARVEEALRFGDSLFWYHYGASYRLGSGLFTEARQYIAAALARVGDAHPLLRGRALAAKGLNELAQGEYEEARASFEASIALVRAHGDDATLAVNLAKLGATHLMLHDADAARRSLDEAFELVRPLPPQMLHSFVLFWRTWATVATGDLELSRALAEEAVQLGRLLSHRTIIAHSMSLLGRVELASGRRDEAFARFSDALRLHVEIGDGWGLQLDLEGLAALAMARGRHAVAVRIMGAADALRERVAVALLGTERSERERLVALARTALGEHYDRLCAEGRAMSMDDVVRLVTDLVGTETAEYHARMPDAPVPLAVPPHPPDGQAPAPRPLLRVQALGPLQVWIGDEPVDVTAWGSARPRELLVYLLMHPEGRTKEQVGLAFWPEASAAQLRNSFHVTLHRLRKALRHPDWITVAADRYRVDPTAVREFDVVEFERDVQAARRALRQHTDGAAASLERALARYHGDFLEGEPVG